MSSVWHGWERRGRLVAQRAQVVSWRKLAGGRRERHRREWWEGKFGGRSLKVWRPHVSAVYWVPRYCFSFKEKDKLMGKCSFYRWGSRPKLAWKSSSGWIGWWISGGYLQSILSSDCLHPLYNAFASLIRGKEYVFKNIIQCSVCVCVHVCVEVHAHMCMLPQDNPGCYSSGPVHLLLLLLPSLYFLGTGCLSGLEIAISVRFVGQLATGICLSPSTFPGSRFQMRAMLVAHCSLSHNSGFLSHPPVLNLSGITFYIYCMKLYRQFKLLMT